ncbi:hypothetical protein I6E29_03035 [Arcanobacterium haemolyticum]|nr:hypothetical protein [Arcanobacterium haemolyticum]
MNWIKTQALALRSALLRADAAFDRDKVQDRSRWIYLWCQAAWLFITIGLVRYLILDLIGDGDTFRYLRKWDGIHYQNIAHYGYFSEDGTSAPSTKIYYTRLAFFPGLPTLIRILHVIIPNYTVAGVIVACLFGIAMTAAIMAIVWRLGGGTRSQLAASVLILGAPLSITFTMVYTESPFIAMSLWACYFIMMRRWWIAGLFTFFAGFFRLTAIDLWLAFGIVVALTAAKQWKAWVAWLLSVTSLFGYLAFASYHTRAIGGYFGLQNRGWHSKFDFGAQTLTWSAKQLANSTEFGYIISIAAILGAIVVCILAFGRTPAIMWFFSAGVAANIILSGGSMHSRPRLLLPVFIAMIPLVADWARKASRTHLITLSIAWVLTGSFISAHMLAVFRWAI